jgi:hypothetical protein
VKKRKRVREVRSCRFAVTITGSACSFDELRRNDRQDCRQKLSLTL